MKNLFWLFNNKKITTIEQIPNHLEVIGFVYKITNTLTGKFYIGKKNLHSVRKVKISKEERELSKTRKVFKQVSKESNWLSYNGSCSELKEDIVRLGADKFKREIIEFCCTKKYLNYCELAHQIKNDVLTSNSYNGNILGRYFLRDMDNCKS
jgi:hypothetical protein